MQKKKKKRESQRRNISQPPDWWEAFDAAAEKRGMSLSEWMGIQCRKALPKAQRDELLPRIPAVRPREES